MSRFWIFSAWAPEYLDLLAENCALLNNEEIFNARQASGTVWSNFPVARLTLNAEDFDLDCFSWESCTFVSRRLRSAMALPPSAAQFFDVDLSRSAGRVQAHDYKIMNVATLEDAIDLLSPTTITKILEPAQPDRIVGFGKSFIPSFNPAHDVFHDRIERGHVFCTDGLTLRVLKAGCTGVRFFDPARWLGWQGTPFRTLRGIERDDGQLLEAISSDGS